MNIAVNRDDWESLHV